MGHDADLNRQKTLLAIVEFGKRLERHEAALGQLQQMVFGWPPSNPQGGLVEHIPTLITRQGFLRNAVLRIAKQLGLTEQDLIDAYQEDVATAKAEAAAVAEEQQPAGSSIAVEEEREAVDLSRLRALAFDAQHEDRQSLPPAESKSAS